MSTCCAWSNRALPVCRVEEWHFGIQNCFELRFDTFARLIGGQYRFTLASKPVDSG